MFEKNWLMAVIAILVSMIGALVWTYYVRKTKRARFGGRESLSARDLCRQFLTAELTEDEVLGFLEDVSRACDVPRGKLRPDDRFDRELAPVPGWEYDDGLSILPDKLQQRFGGSVSDYNVKNLSTLRDMLQRIREQRAAEAQKRLP